MIVLSIFPLFCSLNLILRQLRTLPKATNRACRACIFSICHCITSHLFSPSISFSFSLARFLYRSLSFVSSSLFLYHSVELSITPFVPLFLSPHYLSLYPSLSLYIPFSLFYVLLLLHNNVRYSYYNCMGNLLKVMHWHIENIQALLARFVALAVFSAIAKSNLKNKRSEKIDKTIIF